MFHDFRPLRYLANSISGHFGWISIQCLNNRPKWPAIRNYSISGGRLSKLQFPCFTISGRPDNRPLRYSANSISRHFGWISIQCLDNRPIQYSTTSVSGQFDFISTQCFNNWPKWLDIRNYLISGGWLSVEMIF